MANHDTSIKKKESSAINKEIGKRVGELRECKDFTQEKLAAILDITPRHMAHIESGDRGLTVENAVILADEFDISLDYIYRGKTVSDRLDPVCQLVFDTMSAVRNEATKELYTKTIIDLSHLMIKAQSR